MNFLIAYLKILYCICLNFARQKLKACDFYELYVDKEARFKVVGNYCKMRQNTYDFDCYQKRTFKIGQSCRVKFEEVCKGKVNRKMK